MTFLMVLLSGFELLFVLSNDYSPVLTAPKYHYRHEVNLLPGSEDVYGLEFLQRDVKFVEPSDDGASVLSYHQHQRLYNPENYYTNDQTQQNLPQIKEINVIYRIHTYNNEDFMSTTSSDSDTSSPDSFVNLIRSVRTMIKLGQGYILSPMLLRPNGMYIRVIRIIRIILTLFT